jgi:hypothetical protein
MAGLVPAIHVLSSDLKFVDALTRPGMTRKLGIPPKYAAPEKASGTNTGCAVCPGPLHRQE